MSDATSLVTSLAPAFAAGFAIQHLIEIIDPKLPRGKARKKLAAGWISTVLGALAVALSDGKLLLMHQLLGSKVAASTFAATSSLVWVDFVVSSLFIGAGTEGFNSILKFIEYKKDDAKAPATPSDHVQAALNTVSLPSKPTL